MRRTIAGAAVAALCLAGLAGCSSSAATPAVSASPSTAASSLSIKYDEAAQFEIETPGGAVVFIDVWDATVLAHTPTARDILLTTHGHPDHLAPDFEAAFPGQKLTVKAGTLTADGIAVESIPASHAEGMEPSAEGGSNYIFVIDVAGLRLAHFGDLGQDELTDEQMAKLGQVDVAFSQLDNSFSMMSLDNRKGFNHMNQVKPKLFVVTHTSAATTEAAAKEWKSAWATGPITVSKDRLPSEMTCLFMGAQAKGLGSLLGIPPYEG